MNITNHPYLKCIISRNNPYLDTVTFKPVESDAIKKIQISFLFDRLICVTDAVPYILCVPDGRKIPAPFYTEIMKEVENYSERYNCNKQDLQRAYGITFEVLNNISSQYNKNKCVDENVFKYGFTILNKNFLVDAYNGSINKKYFVDGMLKMSNSLVKFKK